MNKPIIVRNCPSPTGLFHIGTLRTALYNYLFAKKHGGEILFRSEDTDKDRSTIEFEENIISGLVKMGMLEEGIEVIRQSERTSLYREHLEILIEEDKAYYCFMTPEELEQERIVQTKNGLPPRYSGKYRDYPKEESLKRIEKGEKAVIRLKIIEEKDIVINDLIKGETIINTRELADFVIARDMDSPLYNFTVVIDDKHMDVTHVLRGEDHIPNTPKQILVYEAFDWAPPLFGHFPLILNADKSKLSKRKNKVSVDDYLEEGYLPESILNFLVLLGWNPGTEEEIFSLDDMIDKFSLDRVHKGGAVFDLQKLDWLNGMYIREMEVSVLIERLHKHLEETPFYEQVLAHGNEYLKKVILSVQGKMKKLSEVEELIEFYYKTPHPNTEILKSDKMKVDDAMAKKAIIASKEVLENISDKDFTEEKIKEEMIKKIGEMGVKNGQILWPMRAALTGAEASPGAFEVAEILGKKECLHRLDEMLEKL